MRISVMIIVLTAWGCANDDARTQPIDSDVDAARFDTGLDLSVPDFAVPDFAVADAAPDGPPPDSQPPDAAVPDVAGPDAATPDVALPDAALPDAAPDVSPDVETLDEGVPDANPDSDALDMGADTDPDMADVEPDCTVASCVVNTTPTYDPGPTAGNILKGFATNYAWAEPTTDFPISLEYINLPLRVLMAGPELFTFEAVLEPRLEAALARGNHAILRVVLDTPTEPTGVPGYLADQIEFDDYEEFGGGRSPDYQDERLITALETFIEAFGARYDGDRRVGFVQVGLLGFWGEWHTSPHEEWFPDEATQNRILLAFDAAFDATPLQVRRPAAMSPTLDMGFHDDSFVYSTLGELAWFFLPSLEAADAAERWQQFPVGGELRPALQSVVFSEDYEVGEFTQDFGAAVAQTHASYLLNFHAYNGNAGIGYRAGDRPRAEAGAIALGYSVTAEQIDLVRNYRCGVEESAIRVAVSNRGVAPFYGELSVAVVDANGLLVATSQIPRLLPGDDAVTVEISIGAAALPISVALYSPARLPGQRLSWANAEVNATGGIPLEPCGD